MRGYHVRHILRNVLHASNLPRTEQHSTKLFVGNLPRNCFADDLRALFETIGPVSECDVVKDYAFVHYHEPADAEKALKNLDGVDFNGSSLRIQASHSRVRQKPGMGERDVCYRCGQDGHWSKDCPVDGSRGPRPSPRRGRDDGRRRADFPGPGGMGFPGGRGGGLSPRGGGRGVGRGYGYPPMMADRYHPYDRRPDMSAAYGYPVEYPSPAAYQTVGYPRTEYMQPAAAAYARPEYGAVAAYPPQTDALGRPTPEYYAQRLRGTAAASAYGSAGTLRAGASSSYLDARRAMPQY